MRILAVDVGDRRIGLAVCDEQEMIATPLDTIDNVRNMNDGLRKVLVRAEEEEVGEIVVGLPIPLSGGTNERLAAVEHFVAQLRKLSHVPVTTMDERMTTKIAERVLIQQGVRRKERREVVDRIAAAVILEGYLARRRGGRT